MTDRIDELLGQNGLTDDAADELVELLSPRANGAGLDIPEILDLAAHPALAEAIEERELPPRLQQALAEAIGATSAMLGEWSGAPLDVQAHRMRRRYEREKAKFELVCDKLETVDQKTAAAMVRSYLDTSPAPMFSEQMAAECSGIFEDAESTLLSGRALLTANDGILELLRFDWNDEQRGEQLCTLIDELIDDLDDPVAIATRAVSNGDDDERLVAGVLAVRLGLSKVSHGLLIEVSEATDIAPQAAAFTARLAPSIARHGLGRVLVNILNDGAPAQERGVDRAAISQAIVAARTVLSLIESPLDEMEQVDAEHRETADRVKRAWDFCEKLQQ